VQAIKVYGGVEAEIHIFLILALDKDDFSTSGSGLLFPEESPRHSLEEVR
jgi:hypothetical protein